MNKHRMELQRLVFYVDAQVDHPDIVQTIITVIIMRINIFIFITNSIFGPATTDVKFFLEDSTTMKESTQRVVSSFQQ